MAAYSWDTYTYNGVYLPSNPERGYSETGGANVIRTQMDTGPAKIRKRALSSASLSVSYMMTTDQLTSFEHFVNDVLQNVLRFNYKHPRTGNTEEVRIVPQGGNSYTIDYVAPGYWRAKFMLEILP